VIDIKALTKRFGENEVLRGIDEHVQAATRWSSSGRPAAENPRCCAA
jgi:ABC-type polar amino acid transport system ATPase subunit